MSSSLRSIFDSSSKKNISGWSKNDEKLWYGVRRENASVVNSLLKKGTDPTKISPNEEMSCLHMAARDGFHGMISLIIKEAHYLDLNVRDSKGRTPLHLAVGTGRRDIAQNLIENHADLTATDVEEKGLMHFAVMGGHLGCVELLVTSGAPDDCPDKHGFTPLHYAANKNQATICSILLKNGAYVNYKDSQGMTPLSYSALNGNSSLCTFLISKGADKTITDDQGHDALWHAMNSKQIAVVKVLQGSNHDEENASSKRKRDNSENVYLNPSSHPTFKTLKDEEANQIDSPKSSSMVSLPVNENDRASAIQNDETLLDQVKNNKKPAKTKNREIESEEDNDQETLKQDVFNRKFANSYRKLKNQVEFKDSEDLVSCISETLLQLQTLYKENEKLQDKVKSLEDQLGSQKRASHSHQMLVNSSVDSYADVVVQRDILFEENKHLKALLSKNISDLALLKKAQDFSYDHLENVALVKSGENKRIELKALKNHVQSYIQLESQYKESIATIESLKKELKKLNGKDNKREINSIEFSPSEDWQTLTSSYNNRLLEDFNTVLEGYESLINENDALKASNEMEKRSENSSQIPYIAHDTFRHANETQNSTESVYSNEESLKEENEYLQPTSSKRNSEDFYKVVTQRDILQKEVENLKKIIDNLNSVKMIAEAPESLDRSFKNKIPLNESQESASEKQNNEEVDNLKREIESLRKELDRYEQTHQEVTGLMQDHCIQYFTDSKTSKRSMVNSDLKVLATQLVLNNGALIKTMQEENNYKKELEEQVNKSQMKITSLEKSLNSFGNLAVEKDLLERKVKNLENFIGPNKLDESPLQHVPEKEESYSDCDTNEFIDKFISNNLFLFNDPKTKNPINACFNQIIKLENLKNELIDEKEQLLSSNKANHDKRNSLPKTKEVIRVFQDENYLHPNSNITTQRTPFIVLSNEEDVFTDECIDRDQLGDLFVKKDIIERELAILKCIEFPNEEIKDEKERDIELQLIEINKRIDKIQSLTGVTPTRDSLADNTLQVSDGSQSPSLSPSSAAQQFDKLVKESRGVSRKVPSSSPSSEKDMQELETNEKMIKLGKKEIFLTKYLKQNNDYLKNQIEYLNRILEVKSVNLDLEAVSTDKSTDCSSFDNKEKRRKKKKNLKDSKALLEKLNKENELFSKQLSQTHDQLVFFILGLKDQVKNLKLSEDNVATDGGIEDDTNSENISEFVRNLEMLNAQQRKSLDEKEREIEELNRFPDVHQQLLSKYENLRQEFEKLKEKTFSALASKEKEARDAEIQTLEDESNDFISISKKEINELKAEKDDLVKNLNAEIDELKKKIFEVYSNAKDENESLKKENADMRDKLKLLNSFDKPSTLENKPKKLEKIKIINPNENSKSDVRSNDEDSEASVYLSPTCVSPQISFVSIEKEKIIPFQMCPQNNSPLNHFNTNNFENGDGLVLEESPEEQIEVLCNEVLRLRECLRSAEEELNNYKANEDDTLNEGSSDQETSSAKELAYLRETNRELEKQVVNLEYKMSERKKFERLGMNYELIETKKLLHAKMKDHAEKLSECEEKIEDYEKDIKHLKAKIRVLEMDNEGLMSQMRFYKNSRRATNGPEDNDLIKKMRNENLKLQSFLEILEQTTQPGMHSPKELNDESTKGEKVERKESLSRKHQHDECYKEINRLSKLLTDNELDSKIKINTYKKHLMSCFQGTMTEESRRKLMSLLLEENTQFDVSMVIKE